MHVQDVSRIAQCLNKLIERKTYIPGGDSPMKGTRMLVENFELIPKRDQFRRGLSLCSSLKETSLYESSKYNESKFFLFFISSRATLNDTLTDKNNDILPRTP